MHYPFDDTAITVTTCGRICFKGRKINLSHVFAGQQVGIKQVGEHVWLVTFVWLRTQSAANRSPTAIPC